MGRVVSLIIGMALIIVFAPAEVLRAQQGSRFSVPFSDPSRPGTVRVNLLHSSITVKGTTGRDVVVLSRGRDVSRIQPPADSGGLRRLDPPAGVNVEEENNVMTIHGTWLSGPIGVEVQVPVRTNLVLRAITGDLIIDGVDGEIEATSMTGSIALTNVSGSVVAHANNGRIAAMISRVTPDRPRRRCP